MCRKLLPAAALVAVLGVCVVGATIAPASLYADDNCPNCDPGRKHGHGGPYGARGAGCMPRESSNPDLFYNFYARPACGGVPAEMYPAPYPTPPLVGHTYYTYQPLMPHESLYRHHRSYHQYYNNGRGLNRTTVLWW